MNYRHQFHAGNFADVMKHALLVQLMRAMQKKEKGFLLLDTHAGRGRYDLAAAATGDSLARKPEWPDGIGRLASCADLPDGLAEYAALVREFDRRAGNSAEVPRYYPGSPMLAQALARPQDRLVFCEKQPAECARLREEFQFSPGTEVRETDGYAAIRALLPPPERRALVLIDPPFEAQDEFAQIGRSLGEGLRRFVSGVVCGVVSAYGASTGGRVFRRGAATATAADFGGGVVDRRAGFSDQTQGLRAAGNQSTMAV